VQTLHDLTIGKLQLVVPCGSGHLNFLLHQQVQRQSAALSIITEAIPVLASAENVLLPAVATLWDAIKIRLWDSHGNKVVLLKVKATSMER